MRRWNSLGRALCVSTGALLLVAAGSPSARQEEAALKIGSKAFTESVILAELAAHLAREHGHTVEQARGLGGTRLLWEALLAGQIDVYPEYTGTLLQEILSGEGIEDLAALQEALADRGLALTRSLGFDNTYVIGMQEERAADLGVASIGDLRDHRELRLRFSNEFMQRADGWEALAARYALPHRDVRGLEHALAYEAIGQGQIDVTDLYATDAKILTLNLRALADDLGHFPHYLAVYVYRSELEESAPEFVASLHDLEGSIDERLMMRMNAAVEVDGEGESAAAAQLLSATLKIDAAVEERSTASDILRYTVEHLQMVFVSLALAILVALPLGITAAYCARLAQPILGAVGIIQTIPAIALLVLLIRPVSWFSDDLGYPQAVVALFLYSLLPIVRNTHAGLQGIAPELKESAEALGLPFRVRLWRIELPLASPTILAGIKTAAVINVGFATLGGFIGAGGYGDPIFTGIRLNDYETILEGALPAALLALAVQGLFDLAERRLVPRGLRLPRDE